jgi:hypothetical protein
MKTHMAIFLLWLARILLGFAVLFWALFGGKVVYLYVTGGPAAVNGYVMHVTYAGATFPLAGDPVERVHRVYQGLIAQLLVTWGLREVTGYLTRRARSAKGTAGAMI